MKYLKAKAVKEKFHSAEKQITKDGLYALDVKVDEFLNKLIAQFNGHHRRVTSDIVSLVLGGLNGKTK